METLDDLTAKCIRCGFCLESCPTYGLTGSELESPRGRIYLVKSAAEGRLKWDDVATHLDQCLGCRACETACPSGVEYGKVLEIARSNIPVSLVRRLFLMTVTNPKLLRLSLRIKPPMWFLNKLRMQPSVIAFESPKQLARRVWPEMYADGPTKGPIAMLEGCAMRELFPSVNEATRRVLTRLGFEVSTHDLGCCGALHGHGGQLKVAHEMVSKLKARAGSFVVASNSAGCGSWLKENGLNTKDISELLGELPLESYTAKPLRVTYHDACHLAHGQKITKQPRDVLKRIQGVELVEMTDSTRCCGSAGTYNVFQPDIATELVRQKTMAIEATAADIVILGNPGCHSWIAQHLKSGQRVMHLVEFVEAIASGVDP
ncbi:MAG: heterodisulfide reductase-related iron-sulfur binding cluster [Fimbriimonadaceae bacterium]